MSTTIDVTDVVEKLRTSFVTWATAYVYGLEIAVPGLEWVALPIISDLDRAAIEALLNLLSSSVIMEAFFLNTALRKAGQAQDYLAALAAKSALPATATREEFENAEKAEMAAFRSFVMVTA